MYAQRKIDVDIHERCDDEREHRLGGDSGYIAGSPSANAHARALQQRLVEAYGEVRAEEKLPIRQRMAVIAGATSALWLLVGASIYAVL
ncbi:hypothetical protein [Novosphingobium sp. M1R2S20]|uniref:Uncharacterized protein n=1 Tax=Novosphingobium rhizovicinum TaxID=3228928 RepID=A0ABV3RAZ1_9SPHN